jgi:dipeptidyl aminopeptidase/acylaminoacyl peptidase
MKIPSRMNRVSRRRCLAAFGAVTVAGLAVGRPVGVQAQAAAAAPTASATGRPPLIPIETFARNPQARGLRLSPDRKSLAFIMDANQRAQVAVMDLEKNVITRITNFTKQNTSSFRWVNNERLVISLDHQGNESYGVYAVNKDGSQFRVLVEPPVIQGLRGAAFARYTTVEAPIPGNDREVIVASNDRSARVPDLYRMDVYNGRRTLLTLTRPPEVRDWVIDNDGVARVATSWEKGPRQYVTWYRPTADAPWVEIQRSGPADARFVPLSFAKDDKTLYVRSNIGRDTDAIFSYDPANKTMGPLLFEASDGYDMPDEDITSIDQTSFTNPPGGLLISPDTGEIVGFSYEGAKPVTVWTDPAYAKVQAAIDAALPGRVNRLILAKEGQRMLVVSRSDRHRGTWFWFDPKANSLEPIFEVAPWFKESEMAEMRPIEYRARDGLRIRGYLTLPPGRDPKNLPVVVYPHGGPWARDTWGFDTDAQFFANRGYAVLQMDFRISTGYGRKHFAAGWKQVGRAMQDDKNDALAWLVQQGIGDPKRVCIYGGSYGGYAVLWGLARDPDLYRCGINLVGVSDWDIIMRGLWFQGREIFGPDELSEWIGNIDNAEDRQRLDSISPVKQVARIKAPLLHGYGFNDPRVPIDHLKVMERALRSADKITSSVTYDDEGHGWRNPENRVDWYRRVDAFLKQHNPAD